MIDGENKHCLAAQDKAGLGACDILQEDTLHPCTESERNATGS